MRAERGDGEAGGGAADARPVLLAAWSGVRVSRLRCGPREFPERRPEQHVVSLNLGPATTCECNLGGRGWQAHGIPRDGIGVFPAHVTVAARARRGVDCLVVELAPELGTPPAPGAAPGHALWPAVGAHDPLAAHLVLALAEGARRSGSAASAVAERLATALLAHLVQREAPALAAGGAALAHGRLKRVVDHVAANLDAPLPLRELAALAGMDVFRFVRAFKQATGAPPHRYLVQARVERAKALLADGGLSISEIALRTGFGTPSHFSSVFRRVTRQSPREYRDALP